MSARDGRAGEEHRRAIPERGFRGRGLNRLSHGNGLAGQHRLVDLEADGLGQACVRGDPVALAHEQQVTGHDVLGGDLELVPVAHDGCGSPEAVAQGQHGALGPGFLREPEHRVQDHDQRDRCRLHPLAERRGHDRGDDEQGDDRVFELAEEDPRVRGPLRPARRVRAEAREPVRRFSGRQAPAQVGAEPPLDGLDTFCVRAHCASRVAADVGPRIGVPSHTRFGELRSQGRARR